MNGDNPKGYQMDPVAAPVVENPSRPAMGEAGAGDVMMDAGALPAEGNRMTEPAPGADAGASADTEYPDMEYPDMEPPAATGGEGAEAFAAGSHGEGYLRLVIEVDDGEMKVVDASVVEACEQSVPSLTALDPRPDSLCFQVQFDDATLDGVPVGPVTLFPSCYPREENNFCNVVD